MKKMPCLFVRSFREKGQFRITPEVSPGCEWVINGEGYASIKRDGTACMVRNGFLFKRYDLKKNKTPPQHWEPCEQSMDPITGHWPGWVLVGDEPDSKHHREAFLSSALSDGTYELIGPQFQGNPYGLDKNIFIKHGTEIIECPRSFEELNMFLLGLDQEGVVFHDGGERFAKIRRRDFGFYWPRKTLQGFTGIGVKANG